MFTLTPIRASAVPYAPIETANKRIEPARIDGQSAGRITLFIIVKVLA